MGSSVEETSLTINFIFGIKPSFYIKTFNKMSETEAKTDAPTAEEIKGTKRAAEDEVEDVKKAKTEKNGSSNGKAEVEENGAEAEEEEDEEGLGEEEEGEGEEDLDDEAEGEEGEEEEDGEAKKRRKAMIN